MRILVGPGIKINCQNCNAVSLVEESDVKTDDCGALPAVYCECANCHLIINLKNKPIPKSWIKD
jgi:hypothetical protein